MRRLTLGVLPLLLLAACDRSPLAPEAATRSTAPSLAAQGGQGATVEEVTEERRYPAAGVPFVHACTGQPARLHGGLTVFYRFVTRPDGTMLENWWTLQLHDDFRIVMDGQVWRAIRFAPRHGVVLYEPDGSLAADHGHAVIFTLESETTGAQITVRQHWHFVTNAAGDVVVDFLDTDCKLSD